MNSIYVTKIIPIYGDKMILLTIELVERTDRCSLLRCMVVPQNNADKMPKQWTNSKLKILLHSICSIEFYTWDNIYQTYMMTHYNITHNLLYSCLNSFNYTQLQPALTHFTKVKPLEELSFHWLHLWVITDPYAGTTWDSYGLIN